jgi:hypothetical protein
MKTQCSWCKCIIHPGPEYPISHGICPECAENLRKEIAEEEKKKVKKEIDRREARNFKREIRMEV